MMKVVKRIHVAGLIAAAWLVSCQNSFAECGIASTYSSGSRTANGEHYNPSGISAAHKSLPFGTRVIVRNQRTGRSITVRINDRGPFVAGRIIDLSAGAKSALGMDGLASVCLEVESYGSGAKGFRNTGLREPLQEANSTQPHIQPHIQSHVRSAAKANHAHQARRSYASVHFRGRPKSAAHGSRRRIYASN